MKEGGDKFDGGEFGLSWGRQEVQKAYIFIYKYMLYFISLFSGMEAPMGFVGKRIKSGDSVVVH